MLLHQNCFDFPTFLFLNVSWGSILCWLFCSNQVSEERHKTTINQWYNFIFDLSFEITCCWSCKMNNVQGWKLLFSSIKLISQISSIFLHFRYSCCKMPISFYSNNQTRFPNISLITPEILLNASFLFQLLLLKKISKFLS